jgi:orotate phosphoribosyltransferase
MLKNFITRFLDDQWNVVYKDVHRVSLKQLFCYFYKSINKLPDSKALKSHTGNNFLLLSPMQNTDIASRIAGYLLETGAVKLRPESPFTWSSGWLSPIYCDNRVTLSFPHIRSFIKSALAELIKDRFPEADVIAGVATAGIAQGALVADCLDMPFIYVRPEPKSHGMGNQIEGKLLPGQKVVMLEDLISTGGSSLKAAKAVTDAGAQVLGMAAIFTYGFATAEQNFEKARLPLFCLSNYQTLAEVAVKENYIPEAALDSLKEWRQAPDKWGKMQKEA